MAKARQTTAKAVAENGDAAIVTDVPEVKWVEVRIPYVEELPAGYIQKQVEVQFDPMAAETWKRVTTALIILAEANPVQRPRTQPKSATHTLRWLGAELVNAITSEDSE